MFYYRFCLISKTRTVFIDSVEVFHTYFWIMQSNRKALRVFLKGDRNINKTDCRFTLGYLTVNASEQHPTSLFLKVFILIE